MFTSTPKEERIAIYAFIVALLIEIVAAYIKA